MRSPEHEKAPRTWRTAGRQQLKGELFSAGKNTFSKWRPRPPPPTWLLTQHPDNLLAVVGGRAVGVPVHGTSDLGPEAQKMYKYPNRVKCHGKGIPSIQGRPCSVPSLLGGLQAHDFGFPPAHLEEGPAEVGRKDCPTPRACLVVVRGQASLF